MERATPNHYATLGLDRDCTNEQVRAAYRLLAKQLHPDVNGSAADAVAQTQQLNAAYEILSHPEQRKAYDTELARAEKQIRARGSRVGVLTQDVYLRTDEFLRGATLEVRVKDPANAGGAEVYELNVPPETAPGTRFKLSRNDGSKLVVRARVRPDHRFKSRGADLRCDLRISPQRAAQGGVEFVNGPTGSRLRVNIPRGIARGEILRIDGEGLPKIRGGRGDLLVRVIYRLDVRITRASRR